jgi:DNA-binding TFAR19-related protein (PDSD5 family)
MKDKGKGPAEGLASGELILGRADKDMQAGGRLSLARQKQLERRKISSPITPEGLREWAQLASEYYPETDRRLLLENALPQEARDQLTKLRIPRASAQEAIDALIKDLYQKLPADAGRRLDGEAYAQFFLRCISAAEVRATRYDLDRSEMAITTQAWANFRAGVGTDWLYLRTVINSVRGSQLGERRLEDLLEDLRKIDYELPQAPAAVAAAVPSAAGTPEYEFEDTTVAAVGGWMPVRGRGGRGRGRGGRGRGSEGGRGRGGSGGGADDSGNNNDTSGNTRGRGRGDGAPPGKFNGQCWGCDEWGHRLKECPHAKPQGNV